MSVDTRSADVCAFCNSSSSLNGPPLKRCSRCHNVLYCSVVCQRSHWKTHKQTCSSRITVTTNDNTASTSSFSSGSTDLPTAFGDLLLTSHIPRKDLDPDCYKMISMYGVGRWDCTTDHNVTGLWTAGVATCYVMFIKGKSRFALAHICSNFNLGRAVVTEANWVHEAGCTTEVTVLKGALFVTCSSVDHDKLMREDDAQYQQRHALADANTLKRSELHFETAEVVQEIRDALAEACIAATVSVMEKPLSTGVVAVDGQGKLFVPNAQTFRRDYYTSNITSGARETKLKRLEANEKRYLRLKDDFVFDVQYGPT